MKLSSTRAAAIFAILSASLACVAIAHHSRAMYDYTKKKIELTGTVVEFQYSFPHTFLVVDVPGKDGKLVRWGIEGGGPPSMTQIGVRKGAFPNGSKVKVVAVPHREGKPRALWFEITRLSDGKVFPLGAAL